MQKKLQIFCCIFEIHADASISHSAATINRINRFIDNEISNRFDATNFIIDFYRLRRLIVAALSYSDAYTAVGTITLKPSVGPHP